MPTGFHGLIWASCRICGRLNKTRIFNGEKFMTLPFKIGHHTDLQNITGCTIILCPDQTVASCHICGSSPGSRELALLAPDKKMESIQALLLTGGSAFGLSAADGVMQYLEEKGLGYPTSCGLIPIVPAAVIYDLNIGSNKIRPRPENAYQACQNATDDFLTQGSIGAATGATVGKWAGLEYAMKGGLGISKIALDQAWIIAISVVNSVGDVLDSAGQIIAGAIDPNRKFLARTSGLKFRSGAGSGFGENTVLCALLTNIRLSKMQAYLLARRGQNGLARAIVPATTSYDGDVIFCLSHGQVDLDPDIAFEMGSEVVQMSISESVRQAQGLGGFPAMADLAGRTKRR
jgi:L-aminopeptidase/D-esterase-like protein